MTYVIQRDNNNSGRSLRTEKIILREIEPKSFGIAMGDAANSAGYSKSDVKRVSQQVDVTE